MEIHSPIVALLTPFDSDGRIDFDSLTSYLQYLSNRGVKSIITNGTTGEFYSLTLEQRQSLLEHCAKHFDGALINHISSTCLQNVCELARHSCDFAQYVLVLPPYYYANPRSEGVDLFFSKVLEAASLPVFLYNFPLHVQYCIQAELIQSLRNRFSNLVGVKDSSGCLEVAEGFSNIDPSLQVYVGSDSQSLDALQHGLSGSVTGAGSSFPECLVKIREFFSTGQVLIAQKIQNLFNEQWNSWRKGLAVEEVSLTKCALSARLNGFPIHVQPPLTELNQAQIKLIHFKTLDFQQNLTETLEQITDGLN